MRRDVMCKPWENLGSRLWQQFHFQSCQGRFHSGESEPGDEWMGVDEAAVQYP